MGSPTIVSPSTEAGLSAYKTLETMIDKMNGQLALGHRLRGVNVRQVASSVVRSHFPSGLRGNLNAYGRQKVRCLKCAHSYRRMPLSGTCIQPKTGRGLSSMGVAKAEGGLCNGNLALTVSEGAVRKYIEVMRFVMDHYEVDLYATKRRLVGIQRRFAVQQRPCQATLALRLFVSHRIGSRHGESLSSQAIGSSSRSNCLVLNRGFLRCLFIGFSLRPASDEGPHALFAPGEGDEQQREHHMPCRLNGCKRFEIQSLFDINALVHHRFNRVRARC